ncbi:hypothetical protein PS710_03171 [Pseudomonas fluorescens]|uniref:Uncharacterized protein n=1 Tax=Pseudomonas fluorescens TaxID=294 RepID=A0A5E6T8E4_PSEFL|nr:hypothetical protein PS639_02697 [Pseudomonas fluorescens]VVO07402.1 hypothetical protein PS710_03171 [Pseudomonas fluorescens]
MKLLTTLWSVISPDRRPEWEKAREREFILAANSLKTLKVTPEGGMSIDPEELRDQIVASREQLKHLVHKPRAPSQPFKAVADLQVEQEAESCVAASVDALDCIEVVAWRRMASGSSVRYVCLQSLKTGKCAVASASLFTGDAHNLPPWVDANTDRQVADALRRSKLQWFGTVGEAMDSWDSNL